MKEQAPPFNHIQPVHLDTSYLVLFWTMTVLSHTSTLLTTAFAATFALLLSFLSVDACTIYQVPRDGTFLVEDSLRRTNDPTKLVARMGYYHQTTENYREPETLELVTIDVQSGQISWGYPDNGNIKSARAALTVTARTH